MMNTTGPKPLPQSRRILVATDGGPSSDAALSWARALARPHEASRIWLVHVPPPAFVGEAAGMAGAVAYASRAQELRSDAEDILRLAERALIGARVESVLGFGEPAREIAQLAADVKADILVVGSHGRSGVGRALLGSVSESVKDRAPCDVLIARMPAPPSQILAAFDGSEPSTRATSIGISLAREMGAAFDAVNVRTLDAPQRVWKSKFNEDFGLVLHEETVGSTREIAGTILDRARRTHASLIVAGSRGLGRVKRAFVGSVGNRIAREATMSVLLSKPKE